MYIKNNNYYFDENNYLHFNNVRFVMKNYDDSNATNEIMDSAEYLIELSLHFNYDILNYEIHIEFMEYERLLPSSYLKSLTLNGKSMNIITLLYNIRKIMSLLYNTLLICKQQRSIVRLYKNFDMRLLTFFIYKKLRPINNLIILNAYHVETADITAELYIADDIKYNNTILAIRPSNINDIPINRIIIKDNVVYTTHMTIIHPGSYNLNLNKSIPYSITNISRYGESFITLWSRNCELSCWAPPPLLVKFINNIELFSKIKCAYINSEHDLLRYI